MHCPCRVAELFISWQWCLLPWAFFPAVFNRCRSRIRASNADSFIPYSSKARRMGVAWPGWAAPCREDRKAFLRYTSACRSQVHSTSLHPNSHNKCNFVTFTTSRFACMFATGNSYNIQVCFLNHILVINKFYFVIITYHPVWRKLPWPFQERIQWPKWACLQFLLHTSFSKLRGFAKSTINWSIFVQKGEFSHILYTPIPKRPW